MANSGNLSTKKKRAIAALLTEDTQAAAAKKAGVGHRTLCRWLAENSDFQQALAEAESAAVAGAARSIAQGAAEAVNVLRGIMNDPHSNKRVKIAAANSILLHLPKVRLLGNLEAAIIELGELR